MNFPAHIPNSPSSSVPGAGEKSGGIFLVDDHPITRAGLVSLIRAETDLWVCGQAENVEAALAAILELRPDVVVTDLSLKNSSGLDLIAKLMMAAPTQRVLAMSIHDESVYAERVIRAGGRGYLMKKEASEKFIPALRLLLAGEIYLSEPMVKKLLSGFRFRGKGEKPLFPMDTLSSRELEVFQLIGNGYTTREISQQLELTTKTIDSYREHLKIKLGLADSAELVRRAILWAGMNRIGEAGS